MPTETKVPKSSLIALGDIDADGTGLSSSFVPNGADLSSESNGYLRSKDTPMAISDCGTMTSRSASTSDTVLTSETAESAPSAPVEDAEAGAEEALLGLSMVDPPGVKQEVKATNDGYMGTEKSETIKPMATDITAAACLVGLSSAEVSSVSSTTHRAVPAALISGKSNPSFSNTDIDNNVQMMDSDCTIVPSSSSAPVTPSAGVSSETIGVIDDRRVTDGHWRAGPASEDTVVGRGDVALSSADDHSFAEATRASNMNPKAISGDRTETEVVGSCETDSMGKRYPIDLSAQSGDGRGGASSASGTHSTGCVYIVNNNCAVARQNEDSVNDIQYFAENWVQCENPDCLKWRKLPYHVNLELLPDKFFCKDNVWTANPSCDVPEEPDDTIYFGHLEENFTPANDENKCPNTAESSPGFKTPKRKQKKVSVVAGTPRSAKKKSSRGRGRPRKNFGTPSAKKNSTPLRTRSPGPSSANFVTPTPKGREKKGGPAWSTSSNNSAHTPHGDVVLQQVQKTPPPSLPELKRSSNKSKGPILKPIKKSYYSSRSLKGSSEEVKTVHPKKVAVNGRIFPEVVHEMITYATKHMPHIVSWAADGDAFKVFKTDEQLHPLLQRYFRHCKYSSFQRQLNMYGWKKHVSGQYAGMFTHPQFHRDIKSVRRLRDIIRKDYRDNAGSATPMKEGSNTASQSKKTSARGRPLKKIDSETEFKSSNVLPNSTHEIDRSTLKRKAFKNACTTIKNVLTEQEKPDAISDDDLEEDAKSLLQLGKRRKGDAYGRGKVLVVQDSSCLKVVQSSSALVASSRRVEPAGIMFSPLKSCKEPRSGVGPASPESKVLPGRVSTPVKTNSFVTPFSQFKADSFRSNDEASISPSVAATKGSPRVPLQSACLLDKVEKAVAPDTLKIDSASSGNKNLSHTRKEPSGRSIKEKEAPVVSTFESVSSASSNLAPPKSPGVNDMDLKSLGSLAGTGMNSVEYQRACYQLSDMWSPHVSKSPSFSLGMNIKVETPQPNYSFKANCKSPNVLSFMADFASGLPHLNETASGNKIASGAHSVRPGFLPMRDVTSEMHDQELAYKTLSIHPPNDNVDLCEEFSPFITREVLTGSNVCSPTIGQHNESEMIAFSWKSSRSVIDDNAISNLPQFNFKPSMAGPEDPMLGFEVLPPLKTAEESKSKDISKEVETNTPSKTSPQTHHGTPCTDDLKCDEDMNSASDASSFASSQGPDFVARIVRYERN